MENSLLKNESRQIKVEHTYHNLINVDSDLDDDESFYEGGNASAQKVRINSDNPLNKAIKHRATRQEEPKAQVLKPSLTPIPSEDPNSIKTGNTSTS